MVVMTINLAPRPVTDTMTTSDAWRSDRLDLDGYLGRLDIPARAPSWAALNEIHEAHLRTFTFDNADVLLAQHPGVDLDAVQEKFVGRGRGGYCFEHSTIFAAALEQLGYQVFRRLARVGDPAKGSVGTRSHLVVVVDVDGELLLADPGFGMSIVHPIPLLDGHEEEQFGERFRIVRVHEGAVGAWQMQRLRDGGWEVQHTTDELPVHPVDVATGHYGTSTSPESHFTRNLVVARRLPDRHVTLTGDSVTIRRPGVATEHLDLTVEDLPAWLDVVDPHLSASETDALLAWATSHRDG